jgi:hypothetical protein
MLSRLVARNCRASRQRRVHRLRRRLELEVLEARTLLTGTWAPLVHAAPSPDGIGTMMLLTDGTVIAEGGNVDNTWYQLTPNSAGSYVNGTWRSLASMHITRLYFGSNILTDGRAFVVGGEYSSDGGFSRTGEIYDPLTNAWTNTANFPQPEFGDDPTILLPDGRVLAGYVSGPQTYIYNPASNAWSQAGTKLRNDQSDEETWVKLPDGSILSYDIFASVGTGVGHAQRYVPATNTWVDASTGAPSNLSSAAVGYEMGPALLLPDGRVFQLGATGHTAFYNPATDRWTAGPDIPGGLGADDAPGAMLPNGHVLFAADHPLFNNPTRIFEFNPTNNTYTDVTPAGSIVNLANDPSFVCRMLVLPTGQLLLTDGPSQAIYTPDGAADPAWKPTITQIDSNGDGTFTLTGTQLNGLSQGASYGDDAEMDSNFPIIRLTGDDGTVRYARTYQWSSTGVATGDTPVTTAFSLPFGTPPLHFALEVVANGIASDPVDFVAGAGPSVIAASPNHDTFGVVDHVRVTFDEEIDPATFTPGQVDSFTRTDSLGTTDLRPALLGVAPVAGSGNQQFDISFLGQFPLGQYALTLGPDILDPMGRPMDQNHNGNPGEVPQDEFTARFTLQGLKVVASSFAPNTNFLPGALSNIVLAFNEPVNPTTFTTSQIRFTGPNGDIDPSGLTITPVAGSDNTQFRIQFATLTVTGAYGLTVGPNLQDLSGHRMDQNGNFIDGEDGDAFQLPFGVQGLRVLDSSFTSQGSFPYLLHLVFNESVLASTLTADQIHISGPGGAVPVVAVLPVTGSNFSQFDVLFQPPTAAGGYMAVIGPFVQDVFGNVMDQNNNLVPGEGADDAYTTSVTVHGPSVVSTTLSGIILANQSTGRVVFDRPLDLTSVTPDEFQITGPGGASVPVTSVAVVPGTNNTQFDVTFDLAAGPGTYMLHVGPDLRDVYGNAMDVAFASTFSNADGFGYQVLTAGFTPGSIVGLPGTFTVVNSGDFASNPINVAGNTFNFYGTTYTGNNQLYVSTKGLISFGGANTEYINGDLTSDPSQPTIAVLWNDWVGDTSPAVVARFDAFDGGGVPHQLIIEWNQEHHFAFTGTVSFQAILSINTGTAAGDIVFNYLNLASGDVNAEGNDATVGIKATGTQGPNRLVLNTSTTGVSPLVGTGKALRLSVGNTLRVTDASPDGVTVAWTAAGAAGVIGYRVQRSTDGVHFSDIGATDAATLTFTDPDVQLGTTYYYRVRSFDASGDLLFSTVDSVSLGGTLDHSGGFADHGDLAANGSTLFTGSAVQLTSGAAGVLNQAGSVFSTSRFSVGAFTTSFTIQMTAGSVPVGNGMTFILQGTGRNALGPNGGGLGYGPDQPNTGQRGIRNSVAIKFKTVINVAGQETDNATGLFTDGRSPTVPEAGSGDVNVNLDPAVIDLKSQDPFLVVMNYDGATLDVVITDTVTGRSAEQQYSVDIPGRVGGNVAYVGFTGATGAVHTAYLVVQDWTFTPTLGGPAPVPPVTGGGTGAQPLPWMVAADSGPAPGPGSPGVSPSAPDTVTRGIRDVTTAQSAVTPPPADTTIPVRAGKEARDGVQAALDELFGMGEVLGGMPPA